MNKTILLDLDGTLTDTADESFKPMKDGLIDTDISKINVIDGAVEFVQQLKNAGHNVFIISDSHPKYVNKINDSFFKVEALSLADKPNKVKTKGFLAQHIQDLSSTQLYMIGDTWLDITLGRSLGCPTILTNFYRTSNIQVRDGIGQSRKNLKSGPTYSVENFSQIQDILENPTKNLLCLEAVFQGENSTNALKLRTENKNRLIAYRALARQESGECDVYGIATKYYEFQRENRTKDLLEKLAIACTHYLNSVTSFSKIKWDYFTYVSDKSTTIPPNKMKELFDLIDLNIPKVKLLEWSNNVNGSIKNQENRDQRIDFVNKYLNVRNEINLENKNIIIIDDQITTWGTADSICTKLIAKGANNLLFLSLFHLITPLESDKVCPKCNTIMEIKINKKDGSRFYSCTPPQFRGKGCGNTVNIN